WLGSLRVAHYHCSKRLTYGLIANPCRINLPGQNYTRHALSSTATKTPGRRTSETPRKPAVGTSVRPSCGLHAERDGAHRGLDVDGRARLARVDPSAPVSRLRQSPSQDCHVRSRSCRRP